MSKKMKLWLNIATSLIFIGIVIFVGVMSVFKWDFKKLSTDKFATNEYKINESFQNISIRTINADVIFAPAKGEETTIICYEDKKATHSVAVKDGTLIIEASDAKKWYHHLGIHLENPKITISVPKGKYNALVIKNTTGDIKIPRFFSFNGADISVTTGDICIEASVGGNINCKTTTGDVELNNITCGSLTASCTTGDIKMKNLIAQNNMNISLSTGDVTFESCDAAEIFIKATTGNVEGTLLSSKSFEAKSTTGRVDVPKSNIGGKCKVKTTTGHIKIKLIA